MLSYIRWFFYTYTTNTCQCNANTSDTKTKILRHINWFWNVIVGSGCCRNHAPQILPKYRPRYPIYSSDCISSEVECRVTFTISTWNKETNANRIISIAHFNCVIENEFHDVFLFLCTTSNINLSHHWMWSWTFIFICCFRSFPLANAVKAFNLSFQSKFYGRERQRLRIHTVYWVVL